jgi:hypothetical protein
MVDELQRKEATLALLTSPLLRRERGVDASRFPEGCARRGARIGGTELQMLEYELGSMHDSLSA